MRLLNYLLIALLLMFISCEKETTNPNDGESKLCETIEEATIHFSEDAYFIAIDQIFIDTISAYGKFKDSIVLPHELYDDIIGRIGKVYEIENSLERDSVVELYGIHQHKYFDPKKVQIKSEKGMDWSENLISGIIPTGNAIFDSFYQEYAFSFEGVFEWGNRYVITLKIGSNENLNILGLVNRLAEIEGVFSSNPDWVGNGWNRISMVINEENDFIFFFKRRWQCDSEGCSKERVWEFLVNENCDVEFLISYGDRIQ